MEVVDTVEIHVLCVPGEGGLPHAKVQVGSVHPLDHDATLLLHHVQQRVQVADVPLTDLLETHTQTEEGGGCEYGDPMKAYWLHLTNKLNEKKPCL